MSFNPDLGDVPIVGRTKVAARFGVCARTLERWEKNPVLCRQYRLDKFTFRLGHRVATTPRLAVEFIEHVRKNDPREQMKRALVEALSEVPS